MSKGLYRLSLTELSLKIREGEISPSDLVMEYLERIDKMNDKLNAYISIYREEALREAKRAEEAIKEKKKIGLLHGIPIALKDVFDVKGKPTTYACKAFLQNIAKEDATVVKRLKKEGAIILGKLNLHEIAYGPTSEDSYFGPCRNPWNLDHVTGGSSGGSAAAVAASLCAASLGTDAGGSIRVPSSFCGIVGLKPTYARVSRYGSGVCSWSLDHVGPMVKRVKDAELLLKIISGYDPKDPTTLIPRRRKKLKRIKIGIPKNYFFDTVDSEVKRAVLSALDKLEAFDMEEVNLPYVEYMRSLTLLIMSSEISSFHEDFKLEDYGEYVRGRLELGRIIYATEYIKAQRFRALMYKEFLKVMKKIDIIVTPTTPIVAPKMGQKSVNIDGKEVNVRAIIPIFTSPFNLLGLPALSLPCGFSSSGLPIGIQMVGRPFEEDTILRVAEAYEKITEWFKREP